MRGNLVVGLAASTTTANQQVKQFQAQAAKMKLQPVISPLALKSGQRRSATTDHGGLYNAQELRVLESDLKNFSTELEDIVRNFHDRSDGPSPEELERLRLEEEQKKKEERQRRQREKLARNARNPKMRVEVKLEASRELGQDFKNLPTQVHLDPRANGVMDRLEFVDIPMLQARCIGLNGLAASQYELVVMKADEKAKQHRWLSKQESLPNFLKLNKEKAGSKAHCRGQAPRCKSASQRAEWTFKELQAEFLQAQLQERRQKQMEEKARRLSERAVRSASRRPSSAEGSVAMSVLSKARRSSISMGSLNMEVEKSKSMPVSPAPVQLQLEKMGVLQRLICKGQALKSKTEGLWKVFRFAGSIIWLLQSIRLRHKAAGQVLDFCNRIVVFKQNQQVMRRQIRRVLRLQSLFRSFMFRKKEWCEQVGKLWSLWELQHLQAYWKSKEKERHGTGHQEKKSAFVVPTCPSTAKKRLKNSTDPVDTLAAIAAHQYHLVDWQAFKIPAAHRTFTLGRWYIFQVRARIMFQEIFTEVVDSAASENKEIQHFLRLCGLADERRLSDQDKPSQKPYRLRRFLVPAVLGEREAFELISIAAKELESTLPFEEHPCNKQAAERLKQGGKPDPPLSERFRKLLLQPDSVKGALKTKAAHWISHSHPVEVSSKVSKVSKTRGPVTVDNLLSQIGSPRVLQALNTGAANDTASSCADGEQVESVELQSLEQEDSTANQAE